MQTLDLIVVGGGPGGYVAAIKAAQRGFSVALAERDLVGGTCLNRGCIPTKSLLHAARLHREMALCERLGLSVQGLSYDAEALCRNKDETVQRLREGVEHLLEANKIRLLRGDARVEAPGQVQVETAEGPQRITARYILLATGAQPVRPPIEGADLPGVLTSDELLARPDALNGALTVIGGGVIGMEFAALLSGLGRAVTVLEAEARILSGLDREIAQNLSMIAKRRGIAVHTGARVQRIERRGDGLVCHFAQKDEVHEVGSDSVLLAVGRRPNTQALLPEGLLGDCSRGIVVDEHFETAARGIYAIGDVLKGGLQLAHLASAQGAAAVAHMAGQPPEVELSAVPACIYTDPEIATVGLTADEARQQGIEVGVGKYAMSGNGRTVIERQDRGFVKLVFEAQSGVLLGAQLMCDRASDLICELTTAVVNKLTAEQLLRGIRPHPSFAEGVGEAAEDFLGRATHVAPRR